MAKDDDQENEFDIFKVFNDESKDDVRKKEVLA